MRIEKVIRRICSMWILLFLTVFPGSGKEKNRDMNSFDTPDFAYPKQVEVNARVQLEKALKKGEETNVLRAAMQMVIAENLISRENGKKGTELFDSLSRQLRPPFDALSLLLEADLFKDIYSSNRYQYDQRVLPSGNVPADISEWSRGMFADTIQRLVRKAMKLESHDKEKNLSTISSLITNSEAASEIGLTLYDFMTIRAIETLKPFMNSDTRNIPFSASEKNESADTGSISSFIKELTQSNEEWHRKRGISRSGAAMALFNLSYLSQGNEKEALKRLISEYDKSPYCADFYLRLNRLCYARGSKEDKELYKAIENYLVAFPECVSSKALKDLLENMRNSMVKINVADQALPQHEIEGEVESTNLNEFYLLAVQVDSSLAGKQIKQANVRSGKNVSSVKIILPPDSVEIPFREKKKFKISGLNSGVYALVVSRTPDLSGLQWDIQASSEIPSILISRLSGIRTSFENGDQTNEQSYFVVDGFTQQPVEGAKVVFIPAWKNRNWQTVALSTDKEGKVKIPVGTYDVKVSKGNDLYLDRVYEGGYSRSERRELRGSLFTDLSIYHPGDTVGFTGIVYSKENTDLRAGTGKKVSVVLLNANYQPQDTIQLTTDQFGRVSGRIKIAESGLLGTWHLRLADGDHYLSQAYFEVADYKSPTFYIETEGTDGELSVGEVIRIRGKVITYAGMPVGGADIKYDIHYNPWRLWHYERETGNASFGGNLKSENDGSFLIELPTAGLKDTPYAVGRYNLNITATNAAGETQTAPVISFSMGKAYWIETSIPSYIKIDGSEVKSKVGVYDMLDRPVSRKIFYRIFADKDSKEVAKGEFESGRFPFNFDTLVSGQYKAEFSIQPFSEIKEDELESAYNEESIQSVVFTVWRADENRPPVSTPLWLPEETITLPEGTREGDKISIKVGSSYPDSYLLAMTSDLTGSGACRWIKVSDGIIDYEVPAPASGNRVRVIFSGMHNLTAVRKSITLIPEIQEKGVEISAESFRDKITPGARETWKFKLSFNDKALTEAPVMAVMSNKALNALAPFGWTFNPYGSIYWRVPGDISVPNRRNQLWDIQFSKYKSTSTSQLELPRWETYGYTLLGGYGLSSVRIRGGAMMMKASKQESVEESSDGAVYADAVLNEMKVSATAGAAPEIEMPAENGAESENTPQNAEETLRDIDEPLAFFMPDLITDEQGTATLDFQAPQSNGTWQLQVMGYTSDMRGAVSRKDVITSRPIMVSMNAPRFARTGDRLSISANVFNNTVDEQKLGGRIVVMDALTGDVLLDNTVKAENVTSMGSRVITAELLIPGNLNYAVIRVYGEGNKFKDGEQTVIPVYPSSTPVIEGETFYCSPGEKTVSIEIPKGVNSGTRTLIYTDNPIWECITAMPALATPDSKNALASATALYSNSSISGLLKKYPEFREAIRIFNSGKNKGDSTLISNLDKNQSVKIVALDNTPWVRNAQSETLRMERLTKYTEEGNSEAAIAENLKSLQSLMNTDGGWSWCEGMESSVWITTEVLNRLAGACSSGFLPKEGEEMARKAIEYVDKETVKEFRKIGSKHFSYLSLLDYLYIRGMFGKIHDNSEFSMIRRRAVSEIEKEWKRMGIYEKGTAAVVLWKEGKRGEALNILHSLSEYTSESKKKGVWFDNLPGGYNGQNKLLVTARVLESWRLIDPTSPLINGMRQWLLLSKQTEDWGTGMPAVETIRAILDSGTTWTGEAAQPEIFISGRRIDIPKIASLTGSFTFDLSGEEGELTINRSAAGPAWGGIISQYVAPIEDVKPAKVDQLSINKNIYVITADANGTTALSGKLHKGDRVRITLTLKCDRDLQFVTVNDNRSAALEPEIQLSGYTSTDGVWYYREVRDCYTNLFIPYLSKGTHVISYDCFVDRDGEYSLGIATAQSLYAPAITAHSGGSLMTVK